MKKVGIPVVFTAIGLCFFLINCTGKAITQNFSPTPSKDPIMQEILYHASLAPNAHNAQMWKVQHQAGSRQFELRLDYSRSLPHTDPGDREGYLSLGTFLENARQAALALGQEVDIELDDNNNEFRARFFYRPGNMPRNQEILSLMEKRHTDKRNYLPTPISEQLVQTLLAEHAPNLYYYPAGTQGFAWLAENSVQSMNTQSLHQGKREELAHWLRYSNQEAIEKMDGLPAEQLGMRGIKKFFYYLYINPERAVSDTFAQQSVSLQAKQVEHSTGFFVLTGKGSIPGLIYAGMDSERFWLDAARHDIAMQPLSQILEEEPYKDQIVGELGLSEPVQMIFRAGLVDEYGQNNKVRRHWTDFVELVE